MLGEGFWWSATFFTTPLARGKQLGRAPESQVAGLFSVQVRASQAESCYSATPAAKSSNRTVTKLSSMMCIFACMLCKFCDRCARYRREFEKSLPDIFEQFEIGSGLNVSVSQSMKCRHFRKALDGTY